MNARRHQVWVIKLGKPTHFRPNNVNESACGVYSPGFSAYDGRDCDCLNCMKTKKYRRHMGLK